MHRDAVHINTESGYRPWPQGLDLLAKLQLAFDGFPSARSTRLREHGA